MSSMSVLRGEPSSWSACERPDAPEQCYGEIAANGMARLLWLLPERCALRSDSVLYDIGSGFGHFASFLRSRTNSSRVVGVEINGCRAQEAAKLSVPDLTFVQGDVRRIGFADATHVFLTAQCWSSALLSDVTGRLAQQAERLACMTVFGSLPYALELPPILGRWGTIDSFASSVSGTWDPAATALYIVRKSGCNASASCMRKMQKKLAAAELQAAREANVATAAGDSPWRLPPPRWSRRRPLGTWRRSSV